DRGLSIRPEQRPRTVGEFRSLLFAASPEDGLASAPTAPRTPTAVNRATAAHRRRAGTVSASVRRAPLAAAAGVAVLAVVAIVAWLAYGDGATGARTPGAGGANASAAVGPGDASTAAPPAAVGDPSSTAAATPAAVDPGRDASGVAAADGLGLSSVADAALSPANGPADASTIPPGLSVVGRTAPDAADARDARTASVDGASGATEASRRAASTAAGGTGTVRLAVSPWGEVFVDGVSRGVTPPLKQLTLEAGPHRIEIRNPAGPSWSREVDVVAGERTTLSHRFR